MSRKKQSDQSAPPDADPFGGTATEQPADANGKSPKARPIFAAFVTTAVNKATGIREVLAVNRNRVRHARWWEMVSGMVASNYTDLIVYKGRQV